MNIDQYNQKAKELNTKFPSLQAVVNRSPWGGSLQINVSTLDKAKTLREMYPNFAFASSTYK